MLTQVRVALHGAICLAHTAIADSDAALGQVVWSVNAPGLGVWRWRSSSKSSGSRSSSALCYKATVWWHACSLFLTHADVHPHLCDRYVPLASGRRFGPGDGPVPPPVPIKPRHARSLLLISSATTGTPMAAAAAAAEDSQNPPNKLVDNSSQAYSVCPSPPEVLTGVSGRITLSNTQGW